jgi:hypothetical protein
MSVRAKKSFKKPRPKTDPDPDPERKLIFEQKTDPDLNRCHKVNPAGL